MTSAGDLRHRVTFAKRAVIDDGMGNEIMGPWQDQFTVAASVLARFGGEAVLAARLTGTQTYTLIVRQSAQTKQIGVDWRATDARSGLELAIRSIVDPDDEHAWFELLCQSGAAA
jgi:SPP1 family predicted phage head-tail adaptor